MASWGRRGHVRHLFFTAETFQVDRSHRRRRPGPRNSSLSTDPEIYQQRLLNFFNRSLLPRYINSLNYYTDPASQFVCCLYVPHHSMVQCVAVATLLTEKIQLKIYLPPSNSDLFRSNTHQSLSVSAFP